MSIFDDHLFVVSAANLDGAFDLFQLFLSSLFLLITITWYLFPYTLQSSCQQEGQGEGPDKEEADQEDKVCSSVTRVVEGTRKPKIYMKKSCLTLMISPL